MSDTITLRRSVAASKLELAVAATFYFQGASVTYKAEVDAQVVIAVLLGDARARCRVRLSDSLHKVVVEDTKARKSWYELRF